MCTIRLSINKQHKGAFAAQFTFGVSASNARTRLAAVGGDVRLVAFVRRFGTDLGAAKLSLIAYVEQSSVVAVQALI